MPDAPAARWRKYSGLVFCKTRGNSGVTASTSHHWKPQESSLWRWFHIVGKCHTTPGVALPGCGGWSRSGDWSCWLSVSPVSVSILLCSFTHWAWVRRPSALAHEGVKSPGILFMTWRVQEVMNGWLLVFLFKMCCHQALQGPCYRQLLVIFNPA